MPTSYESRAALAVVSGAAVADGDRLLRSLDGSPVENRVVLLEAVPELVGYYGSGSAALAADFYEDSRAAVVGGRFAATPIIEDRTVRIRRGVAWAADPLFSGEVDVASARLAQIVQLEVARPYRATILSNRRADPEAVGWRRVTSGGCSFCRMLADRGAIYMEGTARFAAHPACGCGAEPVFRGGASGPEASVMQYVASKRNRTPAQQAALRDYLATYYGD